MAAARIRRRAADVDLLDQLIEADPRPLGGGRERVEVDRRPARTGRSRRPRAGGDGRAGAGRRGFRRGPAGWSVFTRPSSISGKPVTAATSVTGRPASRSVPGRATGRHELEAERDEARPNASRPVLSETDSSARRGTGRAASARSMSIVRPAGTDLDSAGQEQRRRPAAAGGARLPGSGRGGWSTSSPGRTWTASWSEDRAAVERGVDEMDRARPVTAVPRASASRTAWAPGNAGSERWVGVDDPPGEGRQDRRPEDPHVTRPGRPRRARPRPGSRPGPRPRRPGRTGPREPAPGRSPSRGPARPPSRGPGRPGRRRRGRSSRRARPVRSRPRAPAGSSRRPTRRPRSGRSSASSPGGPARPRHSAGRRARRASTTSPTTMLSTPAEASARIASEAAAGSTDDHHPEAAVERRPQLVVLDPAERPEQAHDRRHRPAPGVEPAPRGRAATSAATLPGSPPPVMWATPSSSWPAASSAARRPRIAGA